MPYITSVERIGMEKGRFSALIDLVKSAKDHGVSDDLVARITGLDISSVHKILNNEPVDIPPRLLKSANVVGTANEML